MKKTLLVVLFVMLAASMFAADLSVSLDAGLMIDKNGLNYRTPTTTDESDYTSSMMVAFDGESFGGSIDIRSEADNAPYAFEAFINDEMWKKNYKKPDTWGNMLYVRNYSVYVKPCQEVKIAIDTGAVELLAENISWEPIHAASLFEVSSSPSLIVTWDVDAHLQVIAGVNTTLKDATKPWTGLGVLASYEVFGLGKFIAKYESLDETLDAGATWDAGLAFQLLALDTQDVYAGYSLIMNKLNPVQHRVEVFYGLNMDSFTLSFFDSLEIKTENDLDIGNRAALKFSYYINNITPSLAVTYYHNFGGGTHIWGAPDVGSSVCDLINIDPRVAFAFGQGTLSTGFRYTLNLKNSKLNSWYIPLGISVSL